MVTIREAWELIGDEGSFRLPGGRAIYEAVLYDEASARSDRPRLARLDRRRARAASGEPVGRRGSAGGGA